jgi:hypothetical protein
VESSKYLGSILTNDGRCTCEIKSRIAMAKAAYLAQAFFLNFSTPCISNVNITGTEKGSIMK